MPDPSPWLVADVGGTHTRCGTGIPGRPAEHVEAFRNREFPSLPAVLRYYLEALPGDRPRSAALAVAAPITGDAVRMLNIDWAFTTAGLARELGLGQVRLLNDYAALAQALPVLGAADLVKLGGGPPRPLAPRVVLGAGTGLGTAGLVAAGTNRWTAVSAEGGHATLPAMDEQEEAAIRAARSRYGHCSAERLVSGQGLSFLYEFLGGAVVDPAEVSRRADLGDARATEAFELAFRFLGTVAGNLALAYGALGGVYVGGGVVTRNLPRFLASGFRARFADKGRYRDYLGALPVQVITAPHAALPGLLHWVAQGAEA